MAEKMTPERASEILGQGFHCSQCVMGHAAEVMGLMLTRLVSAQLLLVAACSGVRCAVLFWVLA